ncbi:hypothetical protein ACFXTN_041297 [Malus domestica]
MAVSITALTSSLSSLSFSSHVAQKPSIASFPGSKSVTCSHVCGTATRAPRLVVASVAAAPPTEVVETENLKKYVKSRLPGGFAAQTIIGTGRRKCAIARVVLQEGTGKVIINYRDAKVSSLSLSVFPQVVRVSNWELGIWDFHVHPVLPFC